MSALCSREDLSHSRYDARLPFAYQTKHLSPRKGSFLIFHLAIVQSRLNGVTQRSLGSTPRTDPLKTNVLRNHVFAIPNSTTLRTLHRITAAIMSHLSSHERIMDMHGHLAKNEFTVQPAQLALHSGSGCCFFHHGVRHSWSQLFASTGDYEDLTNRELKNRTAGHLSSIVVFQIVSFPSPSVHFGTFSCGNLH